MRKLNFATILSLAVTCTLQAAQGMTSDDASDSMEMKCNRASDERVLILVPKDEGCELHYQKLGKSEVVANSVSGEKRCETVRRQIRGSLEAAGFNCH